MVSFSSIAHRALRIYPDFVLGTGNESFSKALKYTVKNRGEQSYFSSVYDGIKKGAVEAEKHNAQINKLRGGFFKSLWHDLKTTPHKISQGWNIGGIKAEKAGKTGFSKFWAQLKGGGSGLMKRMPLIGSLLVVAFEAPNIFRATKDEGIFSGVAETAKAGLRLGAGMTGAAIGQALIPVPILGGLVGFIAGDSLMSLITGKSYTEKKEALNNVTKDADKQYEDALKQLQQMQQGTPYGDLNLTASNNIKPTMTQAQVAALGQQLYNAQAFQDPTNQDFMQLTSGMNKLNTIG